jgi:hypothetical protein
VEVEENDVEVEEEALEEEEAEAETLAASEIRARLEEELYWLRRSPPPAELVSINSGWMLCCHIGMSSWPPVGE